MFIYLKDIHPLESSLLSLVLLGSRGKKSKMLKSSLSGIRNSLKGSLSGLILWQNYSNLKYCYYFKEDFFRFNLCNSWLCFFYNFKILNLKPFFVTNCSNLKDYTATTQKSFFFLRVYSCHSWLVFLSFFFFCVICVICD